MKTRILLTCLVALVVASPILAVDLKNEDSQSYDLKIHDGPATTHSSIEGNTTRTSICSDCTIEVVGVGSIQASGDAVVVIKDGQLSIED